MSLFDMRVVTERKHRHNYIDNENSIAGIYSWTKAMYNSVERETKFYKDNESKPASKIQTVYAVDPELQSLSQKVMKQTWDNKEDAFWDTY